MSSDYLADLAQLPGNALIVMCGVSGSGKSTLANATWPGEVVSSDELRELIAGPAWSADDNHDVFALLHRIVHQRLRRGLRTVVDATNTARWHRDPLHALAGEHGAPVVAVVCWPPLKTCLARNAGRERVVPEDVVRRQYAELTGQLPVMTEGFERVIITGASSWITRAAEGRA